MTNYAEMDPLALNRLAAERAGWTGVAHDSSVPALLGHPPGETMITDVVPDYAGSVDAALTLIPIGKPVELTNDWDLQQGTTKWMADVHGHYAINASLATAIVLAWLAWQDARAGEGA